MDITEVLRDGAQCIEMDGTPSQVGPSSVELRYAADEIVRLRRAARALQNSTQLIVEAWLDKWNIDASRLAIDDLLADLRKSAM